MAIHIFVLLRTLEVANCNIGIVKCLVACLVSEISNRAVARTLTGGGGCIFIYSGSARLISFEINFISKGTSRAEPEYMNIHPPPRQLAF